MSRVLRRFGTRVWVFAVVTAGSLFVTAGPASAASLFPENNGRQLLPAWRWRDATSGFYTNFGTSASDFTKSALLNLAVLPFVATNFIWGVLITLLDFATGLQLVGKMADRINATFAAVGKALIGDSGGSILMTVAVIGIIVGFWQLTKGGTRAMFRAILGTVVPVLLLVGFVDRADGHTANEPMSPAWVALEGTHFVGQVGGSAVHSLTVNGPARTPTTGGETNTCADYVNTLYKMYDQSPSSADTGTVKGGQKADGELGNEDLHDYTDAIPRVVSRLWEISVLNPWISTQLGTKNTSAQRVYCRMTEARDKVPSYAQAEVMNNSQSWPHAPTSGDVAKGKLRTLGPAYPDGDDEMRRFMIGWATCSYHASDGSWHVNAEWKDVKPHKPEEHAATHTSCERMWNDGNSKPDPKPADQSDGPFHYNKSGGFDKATTSNGVDSAAARDYLYALNGHNTPQGFANGALALLATLIVAWAIGGLALGTVVSQFVLVMGLGMAPVFLLLVAIPSAKTRQFAMTGLRMVGAAIVSRVVFLFVLGLLLILMNLFAGLTPYDNSPLVTIVWQALTTLGAVLFLRKLLKKAGLGDIMSLKGAIKTTAAVGQSAVQGNPHGLMHTLKRGAEYQVGRKIGKKVADGLLGPDNDRYGALGGPGGGPGGAGALVPPSGDLAQSFEADNPAWLAPDSSRERFEQAYSRDQAIENRKLGIIPAAYRKMKAVPHAAASAARQAGSAMLDAAAIGLQGFAPGVAGLLSRSAGRLRAHRFTYDPQKDKRENRTARQQAQYRQQLLDAGMPHRWPPRDETISHISEALKNAEADAAAHPGVAFFQNRVDAARRTLDEAVADHEAWHAWAATPEGEAALADVEAQPGGRAYLYSVGVQQRERLAIP
ncbi:MAG TPA: hypothetical protein VHD87_12715 [Acidimicrobiales bacterium]|nr:hypothetical protein [Acidimicrobiales bacterium]